MFRKLFASVAAATAFGWAASDASAQSPPFTHADVRGVMIQGWPITPPAGVIGPISPPAMPRVRYVPQYQPVPTYRRSSYYDPFSQSWVTQQVYWFPNR
jgi:hypothetical protein